MKQLLGIACVIPLLSTVGCDFFNSVGDTVDGLTNQLVAQGVVLRVLPPDLDEIDLSQSGFSEGTTATALLADAGSVTDLNNAPITGASVWIDEGEVETTLVEQGGGAYATQDATTLNYVEGAT